MGTKNNPGSFDCYAAALPDEPLFHLLGRDPTFPATVRFWMGERARLNKNVEKDDLDKLGEAGIVADTAERWRRQIVEAVGTDGDLPWRNRPHVDAYDRGAPVRSGFSNDRPWDGRSGGEVRSVPQFASWHETNRWAVGIGYKGSMTTLPALLSDMDSQGWRFHQHSFSADAMLFERVHFVGGVWADRMAPPPEARSNLISALEENGDLQRELRAKIVVGLSQVTADMKQQMEEFGWESFGPAAINTFMDRINGHAAELGVGLPVDMLPELQADPARGADISHPIVAEVQDKDMAHDMFDGPADDPLDVPPIAEVVKNPDPIYKTRLLGLEPTHFRITSPQQDPDSLAPEGYQFIGYHHLDQSIGLFAPIDCGCGTAERCSQRVDALYASLTDAEIDLLGVRDQKIDMADLATMCRLIYQFEEIIARRANSAGLGRGQQP